MIDVILYGAIALNLVAAANNWRLSRKLERTYREAEAMAEILRADIMRRH